LIALTSEAAGSRFHGRAVSLMYCGVPIGAALAALPNLIALTSEAAGSRFHGRAVSLMYCGVPIGAALAA
ncbi:hypothetical protein C0U44_32415, partial [Klebsiella pneumoniae]